MDPTRTTGHPAFEAFQHPISLSPVGPQPACGGFDLQATTDDDAHPGAPGLLRIENIFHAVLAVPVPQRAAALENRCAGDAELLSELRSLLAASDAEAALGVRRAAQARAAADTAASGRLIGPYRLERLLGRGGMGAVYLAQRADGQFAQQVAVKIIDLPLATELFRERFRMERQILAGLTHPYIARLLDGGVSETGDLYLAMEYVDGVSITAYCREHALTMRQRLALFAKVCEAVQFAHQSFVVHRDLKPDNILVAADGTPRLLDFGTAKLLVPLAVEAGGTAQAAAGFTQLGVHAFTPQYASPEQVLGEGISTATDTYSLGVLLYVMVTGVPPYAMTEFTTSEMLRVICTEAPLRPSAAATTTDQPRPKIDGDLDAMILKAMRKEPQHRYQTVEQFAADVHAWLAGRPVLARRGTFRYRALKFSRRNKLPLAAGSLLGLSIVVGIGGVLWQSHVANLERTRAQDRSADLRQLSNSLLSEIAEAIKNLPGSTSVQHMLVERVLEHLDRMSKDADGDPATLGDLIDAYKRLGDIQGNPYDQNIGDAAGALVSLNKAIDIAAALHAQLPHDDRLLVGLASAQQSRSEILFGIGRTEEAIASMRQALAAFTARASAPGATAQSLADAASAAGGLGDQLGQTGTSSRGDSAAALLAFRQALDLSQRALRVDPGFVRSQRGVAIDHLKIGNLLVESAPAASIAEYRESLAAWEHLPAAEQDSVAVRRGIAMTTMKLALAFNESRDYASAIPTFERARELYQYIAAADPHDARAQFDVAVFLSNEAMTYVDLVNPVLNTERFGEPLANARRGIELMQLSIDVMQKLVVLDPSNVVWSSNFAYQRIVVATLANRNGLPGGGDAAAALALLKRSAHAPTASANELNLATSGLLMILPLRLRDPMTAQAFAERLVALTRRKEADSLLLLAQSFQQNAHPHEAAATAREALDLLPAPAAGAAGTRLRLLLAAQLEPT